MISAARLATWRRAIANLPTGVLTRADILNETFLVGREKHLAAYYAPLDTITTAARIALVGLTPGWQQTRIAFQSFRDAQRAAHTTSDALAAAKRTASFAGMRKRLCAWLDELGVASWLGQPSTGALFGPAQYLLHTTSLIRYPVFVGVDARNYSGYGPAPARSPLLMSLTNELLVPELELLADALIVPMGRTVAAGLAAAGVDAKRCLYGFPHPSGANVHGAAQFTAECASMKAVVAALRD